MGYIGELIIDCGWKGGFKSGIKFFVLNKWVDSSVGSCNGNC